MASKSRGETIKSDIADSGLLSRIPTTSLCRQARHALFYDLLNSLGFTSLPPIQQPLAILYAQKFIEVLEILDSRGVKNQADIEQRISKRLDLDKSYGQLLKLYNALNPPQTSRVKFSQETIEDKGIDLQQILSNLGDHS